MVPELGSSPVQFHHYYAYHEVIFCQSNLNVSSLAPSVFLFLGTNVLQPTLTISFRIRVNTRLHTKESKQLIITKNVNKHNATP